MTALLTTGTYIRLRREARGLTLDDLSIRLETLPPVSARTRAEWLATIEADAAPLSFATAVALRQHLQFDLAVLEELTAAHIGLPSRACSIEICRTCGCTWHDACVDENGRGCAWATEAHDRCTACAPQPLVASEQRAVA